MSQNNSLESGMKIVNTIIDIAAKVNVEPSDNATIQYSESDQFDLSLLASMKGGVSPIDVIMNGFIPLSELDATKPITPSTPRIERWLWKIRESKGKVIACEEGARVIWIILVPIVIGLVADVIRDYVTYKLAENYNAKVFYNPGNEKVQRVEFHLRSPQEFSCG